MALSDDLIAYWKMDEASGQRNDSHGSNHLSDFNTVGSNTGKIQSLGADFTRADGDFLRIVDNADLSLGADTDFTLSLWVKPETDSTENRILFQKNDDFAGAVTGEYQLYNDSSQRLHALVGTGSTFGQLDLVSATLSAGNWAHLIVGHSSSLDKIYLRVNNGTLHENTWAGGTYDSAKPLCFSSQFGSSFAWDGMICDVGFWKGRFLTTAEQDALWNGGAGLAYESIAPAAPTAQLMGQAWF
jgi:hypothetical protein